MVSTDIAFPDYKKWLEEELWTLVEASCLAAGVEPIEYKHDTVPEKLFDLAPDDKRDACEKFYGKIKKGIQAKSLEIIKAFEIVRNGRRTRPLRNSKVRPLVFIRWLIARRLPFPDELREFLYREKQPSDASTPTKSVGNRVSSTPIVDDDIDDISDATNSPDTHGELEPLTTPSLDHGRNALTKDLQRAVGELVVKNQQVPTAESVLKYMRDNSDRFCVTRVIPGNIYWKGSRKLCDTSYARVENAISVIRREWVKINPAL